MDLCIEKHVKAAWDTSYSRCLFNFDWFHSLILPYLRIKEIAILDSSLCNDSRKIWLRCLLKNTLALELSIEKDILFIDFNRVITWILMKNISVHSFSVISSWNGTIVTLSNPVISLFFSNNPKIQQLKFIGECMIDVKCYTSIAANIRYLQTFHLEGSYRCVCNHRYNKRQDEIFNNGFIKIIKENIYLRHIYLTDVKITTDIFFNIGSYCRFLEQFSLKSHDNDIERVNVKNEHIMAFFQGCKSLIGFTIDYPLNCQYDYICQCLGTHNLSLKTLTLNMRYKDDNLENTVLQSPGQLLLQQCTNLNYFSIAGFVIVPKS